MIDLLFRRGGFLASTIEQLLKLDLSKWLKVLRDLDLLPRVLNQDWSSIWLQKFDGDVTILVSNSYTWNDMRLDVVFVLAQGRDL